MNSRDKIVKARAGLVLDEPFFGSLVLRLSLVEDSSCNTLWVNGQSLGYNPAFVDSLSMDVLKGCLCHEVMHCVLSHTTRRGERDSKKWNVAGDYAVNSIIRDKFSLPDGVLFNPDYASMSADEIYNHLPEDKKDSQGPSGGAGGHDQDDQEDSSDPGGCGEVRDCPGEDGGIASAAGRSQAESDWRVAVAQAAQQAQAFGSLPAGMERVVEEIVNPKIDWRALLRRFMDQVAKSDYSWSPPNRRHIYSGLYLPSCRNSDFGTVVVAVDTSGSIDQKALDRVMGELSGIILDARAETYVVYCDSKVQGVDHYIDGDFPDKLNPKGKGGTAFEPVFEWVDQEGISPVCLVYFTDLDGSFPGSGPMYPVLWVTGNKWREAPFGEVLRI